MGSLLAQLFSRRLLVLMLTAAVAWALLPAPAKAATGYQLRSYDSEYCLSSPTGHTSYMELSVRRCDNSREQRFVFVGQTIRPAYSQRKCLESLGSRRHNAARYVALATCNRSLRQSWSTIQLGGFYTPLTRTFQSRLSVNECLDASLPMYDGSRVHLWACHGGNNQRWISQ